MQGVNRIRIYTVAFAPTPGWQADNIVWRVPADVLPTVLQVLIFNGIHSVTFDLEENAQPNR